MARIDENDVIARLHNPQTKRKAFEEMVNAYSRQLYWQIHYILQNHDDTDDVLQNTMLKAWKGIDGFSGGSTLSTWLWRIAHNEAMTWLKLKTESQSIDEEGFVENATFEADDYFDGNDAEKTLMEAVANLPAKQRLVFNMKYFEDKKYEEMSELLGTSIGALKASYHIAVEKISAFVNKNNSSH